MLRDLKRIVQEVDRAPNLEAVLDIIVRRVCQVMEADVCSVYLLDEKGERWVMRANQGFDKEVVHKGISLGQDEGLAGLVASRGEPVNLERASEHPRFVEKSDLQEERFSAYLGVPVIHRRQTLGVLIVQQSERRRFDTGEEAFLVTLSAQLAATIAHAGVAGADLSPDAEIPAGTSFPGVAGADGIAIGTAVVLSREADLRRVPRRRTDDPEAEQRFFLECLKKVRSSIKELASRFGERLQPQELGLFDVYLRILDNDAIAKEVARRIRHGEWAQSALSRVVLAHVAKFEGMEDDYLRERASDIMGLGQRVLAVMQESEPLYREYPQKIILAGEDLAAASLGELPMERLVGLLSVRGSYNSHVAILARALGLPMVVGVTNLPVGRIDGRPMIVDGNRGRVLVESDQKTLAKYQAEQRDERAISQELESIRELPCKTADGTHISLLVNTGLAADISRSAQSGAEGVGLYRTETPFMLRERFPGEEEQCELYREHLQLFAPRPVTMRTLDIGGDKALPYFPIREENPFLGWRGIRITLDHPELFIVQVRAMLRASEGLDNLRIMLPMLSNLDELSFALDLIYRAHSELLEEGVKLQLPPIGVMIEVPAAVYQAQEYARRVDFLSVGSNDLTQYLLAVDRNNPQVANLYQALHPAVLRALEMVADSARSEEKPVGICGELAGEPMAAILLVAMGYDTLSMGAAALPRVKAVLRGLSTEEMKILLTQVRMMESAGEIRRHLRKYLEDRSLERLLLGRERVQ